MGRPFLFGDCIGLRKAEAEHRHRCCLCSSLIKAISCKFCGSASDTRLPVSVTTICYSQAWQSRKEGQGEAMVSCQCSEARAEKLWGSSRTELHWQSPVKTKDTLSGWALKTAQIPSTLPRKGSVWVNRSFWGTSEVSCLALSHATGNKIPVSGLVVNSGKSSISSSLL